eukprot:14128562-Ditylum_brightwellii.AAC.1
MDLKYNKIQEVSEEKGALLTTSNLTFHCYAKTKKDAFNEGKTVDIDTLMRKVKIKYTNLGKSTTCADPKDAKILVLTTKMDNLEKKVASNGSSSKGGNLKGDDKSNSGGKKNNRPPV